jgi:hypothetical protein
MMKVKILVPFRFEIDKKVVEFAPGLGELPEEAVEAFVRAGYVALIDDEPAVKIINKPKVKATKTVKNGEEAE